MYLDPAQQKRILPLKERIAADFTRENWLELGAATGCLDLVQGHSRLLRSLSWDDDDYPANVMDILVAIVSRDPANLKGIEDYISVRLEPEAETVSSVDAGRRIYFTPSVFEAPVEGVDRSLVSVMMPFQESLTPVYKAIEAAAKMQGLKCKRADDIWQHATIIQDIFSLIFRSSIVVCDFTGKNPNVFYECGIAHTLGKHVVPIAQHASDVPFDLRHHRYLPYLNNAEGLDSLRKTLSARLAILVGKPGSTFTF